MHYHPGDRVTPTDPITVDLPDSTVRLTAGLVLEVLDVRPGHVLVIDVDSASEAWVPARLVKAVS
jgi:hypothetical protein